MIKVLLVEDNPIDAQLTQDLLGEWALDQFDISHAPILAEGLAKLSRGRFDVVLLDLSLPDTHGLSTVTQVLATSPDVPVVVLSGHDDHPLALQALQHGAQDYLVKGHGGARSWQPSGMCPQCVPQQHAQRDSPVPPCRSIAPRQYLPGQPTLGTRDDSGHTSHPDSRKFGDVQCVAA